MYHSISETACSWELAVSPNDFSQHLEMLSNHARILSLGEMLAELEEGTLPERSVAITFDDGYADNLHAAKPLLGRYECPATVFVAAGLVGTNAPFWWDELAHLTLAAIELPKVVRLMINGRPFSFALGTDALLGVDTGHHESWRFHEPPPTRRHLLLQKIWQHLQPASDEIRRQVLGDLRNQARLGNSDSPKRRIMGTNEVVELAKGGLVEIGAHTMTHPVLSRLSPEEQEREICESKAVLETIIGSSVRHFAYPHGGQADYTVETVTAVHRAGLEAACTTTEDWLRRDTEPYRLPRVHVPPVSGRGFKGLIDYWL